MSRNILSKTEAEYSLDTIHNFVLEHYTQMRELFNYYAPDDWSENIIQYLKDRDIEPEAREIIATGMTRHFYSGFDWIHAITEEFEKWIGTVNPKTVITKTNITKTNKTKKDTTMTENTNTQINITELIKVKMMEKLMDGDTKDLNLGKMTIVQALANGQTVNFGEVMKAKMTEKLLKAVEAGEDIPLSKLLMLQAMTTNQNFGINDLVQLKLMEKLLDEPEAKEKTKTK